MIMQQQMFAHLILTDVQDEALQHYQLHLRWAWATSALLLVIAAIGFACKKGAVSVVMTFLALLSAILMSLQALLIGVLASGLVIDHNIMHAIELPPVIEDVFENMPETEAAPQEPQPRPRMEPGEPALFSD